MYCFADAAIFDHYDKFCIGYTPRARLLSDLATKCHRHEVAK